MTDTTEKRITIERTINAPSDAIFDVLSNPDRHADLDGSGFVKSIAKGDRLQASGDTFRVNMEGPHMGGEYQTDNHVTGFDKNHILAWSTAPAGTEPPGWEWVWELESQGSDSTVVRHTYDWSKVTDKDLLEKVSFPLIKREQLEATMNQLDQMVTSS